jgi:DNA-directed RNA polymerase subunit RPC12/RpoP
VRPPRLSRNVGQKKKNGGLIQLGRKCIGCGEELFNALAAPLNASQPSGVSHILCTKCFGGYVERNATVGIRFLVHSELDAKPISTKYPQSIKCPHCNNVSHPWQWPSKGDTIPFYCLTVEEAHKNPGGGQQVVICSTCKEMWYVVWDQDPR